MTKLCRAIFPITGALLAFSIVGLQSAGVVDFQAHAANHDRTSLVSSADSSSDLRGDPGSLDTGGKSCSNQAAPMARGMMTRHDASF